MVIEITDRFGNGITVRHELRPGDIGYLIYLHGVLYAAEQGWDHTFEAYVAGPVGEFGKSQSDRERIWIIEKDGAIVGSIAIVESSKEEAQLRWFLLHPSIRGKGIGRRLVGEALSFCRECGYSKVFLLTEGALQAAAKLYLDAGFVLTEELRHEIWGAMVTEQRYELQLK